MRAAFSRLQHFKIRPAAAILCASVLSLQARPALADNEASPDATPQADTLNEIIVTGSRQTGIKAADSAAPIQVVSAATLKTSGAPDLMSALAQTVPSLQMQAFGFDMAELSLQARLRGLSPNHVLVLINGKRRHTTANLAIDSGSPFQGGANVDLNFIPLDAIDHVEVLTDGAAAQYGTDAIAGVINIILKRNSSGGNLAATYGQYGNDGGGRTEDVSGNTGFGVGTGGFLNITGEFRNHGHSNVGDIDPRLYPANLAADGYPNTNAANAPGYPHLNRVSGDGAVQQKIAVLNSGYDFADGTELYFTGTYGHKNASLYANYRMPNKVSYTDPVTGVTTYPEPYGFSPQEAADEDDYQLNLGLKGVIASWNWDLTSGYGSDHFAENTNNSYNAGTYHLNGIPTPTNFYDGYLQATQWVTTLDLNRNFDVGLAGPLNVAFGGEYRRESYSIGAGVPLSYEDGGAQAFPGFTPLDAGSHSRKNYSAYIDLAVKPIENLRVDAAARHEHYSDFGNTTVGKLTARYDFTPEFALRGTASNGFRAPTLAEEYYSSTNVTPSTAYVQLPPDSPAAAPLGLGNGLQAEKSVNFSAGLVWRPIEHMSATLDVYQITVTNRIVGSGNIAGAINGVAQPGEAAINAALAAYSHGSQVIDPDVLTNGSYGVNIFANGIDTRTRGADLVFDFPYNYGFARVNWTVSGTYNDTTITKYATTPAALAPNVLYDRTAYSELTTASPKYVLNLGALATMDRVTINLVEKIYGPTSDYENDFGDNPSGTFIYYKDSIGVTAITNIDVGLQVTDNLKLSIGALNAFNRFPNKLNGTMLSHEKAYQDNDAVTQYPLFSPFGIDGGFYYVKALYQF